MTGNSNTDRGGESWVVEILLPAVFTVILLVCLVHLAFCVFQADAAPSCAAHYTISAYAN